MSHPTWQLDLDSGALVLTPCPGTKGVDLQTSLQQLKEQGVQAVVTALDNAELASKDVADLGEVTQQLGMKWFQIEIEDDCAPSEDFAVKWQQASRDSCSRWQSRDALHGRLGSHWFVRSSLAARKRMDAGRYRARSSGTAPRRVYQTSAA